MVCWLDEASSVVGFFQGWLLCLLTEYGSNVGRWMNVLSSSDCSAKQITLSCSAVRFISYVEMSEDLHRALIPRVLFALPRLSTFQDRSSNLSNTPDEAKHLKQLSIMRSELESAPFLDEAEKPRLEHRNTRLSAARRTKASISSGVASHLTICLITSFFWGALLHFITTDAVMEVRNVFPSPLIAGAKYLLCGHSTEEAKTLGCEYDILSNHWLPAPCMDQDAIREYQYD